MRALAKVTMSGGTHDAEADERPMLASAISAERQMTRTITLIILVISGVCFSELGAELSRG